MQLTFNCFWTTLDLLVGRCLGWRPTIAMKSSSISFLESWTENFGLSVLLVLIFLLNLEATLTPPSIFAGEGKSRFAWSEFTGGLDCICLVLCFHDLRVSVSSCSSLKIVSLIRSASFFRSCVSFSLTAAIPSSSSLPMTTRFSEPLDWLGVAVDSFELGLEERRSALVEGPAPSLMAPYEHLRWRWDPHFKNGRLKLWRGLGLLGLVDIGSVPSSSSSSKPPKTILRRRVNRMRERIG